MDADFNQKLANWENSLLNRYLDQPDAPECPSCGSTNLHSVYYDEHEIECGDCGTTHETEIDYEPDPYDLWIDEQMNPDREDY